SPGSSCIARPRRSARSAFPDTSTPRLVAHRSVVRSRRIPRRLSMKRFTAFAAALALAIYAAPVVAHEGHETPGAKTGKQTLTGEVVDTGCYLAHGARGEKHVSCATKCLSQGMPMGLLTSTGALYLITLDHDDADPYNKLKEMAGKTVRVTGEVMERAGMKGIEATSF